jgi:hypothetical protein
MGLGPQAGTSRRFLVYGHDVSNLDFDGRVAVPVEDENGEDLENEEWAVYRGVAGHAHCIKCGGCLLFKAQIHHCNIPRIDKDIAEVMRKEAAPWDGGYLIQEKDGERVGYPPAIRKTGAARPWDTEPEPWED